MSMTYIALRQISGVWLADCGTERRALREGHDLIDALAAAGLDENPGGLRLEVEPLADVVRPGANNEDPRAWELRLLGPDDEEIGNWVVFASDDSADRVLDDIRRRPEHARSLWDRVEDLAYAGDPEDAVQFGDVRITRADLRTAVQAGGVLTAIGRFISLMPKPQQKDGEC